MTRVEFRFSLVYTVMNKYNKLKSYNELKLETIKYFKKITNNRLNEFDFMESPNSIRNYKEPK